MMRPKLAPNWIGFWFLICALLVHSTTASAQDPFAEHIRKTDPLSPEEAQKAFETLPGLTVDLIASEPEIFKPLNLAFDWRGRLWVSCTIEYPYPAKPGEGHDRIVILEDKDGNGTFETRTVFADDLNIPIGILPYKQGCIVFDIPNICYLSDTDQDGKYDERKVLYGPFDYSRDTHGLNNSFRQGLDGWIYACHGFNNQSRVAGGDGHQVVLQSGNTYRFRPDGSRIEQYSHGQVNPFGMAIDQWFRIFTADCHSKPLTQVVRDGYYPSFGRPSDGLGFAPSMMDHLHGSTAIAGVSMIEGDHWPAYLQGQLVSGNVMTCRVNRNKVIQNGATAIAVEQPDLLKTSDPWFRPVDIISGPDGAIYIADFYNRIIGHYEVPLEHPGRDRSSGRIWRIRPTQGTVGRLPFSQKMVRMNRQLQDDQLAADPSTTNSTIPDPVIWMWTRVRTNPGQVTDLHQWISSAEPLVRSHAMRILAECLPADHQHPDWLKSGQRLASLGCSAADFAQAILQGLQDSDARVRLAALDAAARHPHASYLPEILARVPDGDPMESYYAKVSLKAILSSDDSKEAWAWCDDVQRSVQEQQVALMVCLAVPGPDSAEYVLERLDSLQSHPQFPDFVSHLTSHLPATAIDRLIAKLDPDQPRSGEDEIALLRSLADGVKRGNAEMPVTLKQWATRVAKRWLDQADQADMGWTSRTLTEDGEPEPARDPWKQQTRNRQDGQAIVTISSILRGEDRVGILQSRPLTLGGQLQFQLAGHRGFPNEAAHDKNAVRLRLMETGEVIFNAFPPRNDVATLVIWDTAKWTGEPARLEIVDGDVNDAYAWLAVGEIQLVNDSQVQVIPVEGLLPADRLVYLDQVQQLVNEFQLQAMGKELFGDFDYQKETSLRYRLRRMALSIQHQPFVKALAENIGRSRLPDVAFQRAWEFCQAWGSGPLDREMLAKYSVSASTAEQNLLLESALEDHWVLQMAFDLVKDGKLSATGLLQKSVQDSVALRYPDLVPMVKQLTQALPQVDETWRQAVLRRGRQYRDYLAILTSRGSVQVEDEMNIPGSAASPSRDKGQWHYFGKQVFSKNCAVCHQIAGEGQVVGPQLDGIGQRGLDRVLEDVLLPNQNVDHAFRTTLLQLEDGRVVSGLVRQRDEQSILLTDNAGKSSTIALDDVEGERESQMSLMPEDIARKMNAEESFGLILYLLEQKVTSAQ